MLIHQGRILNVVIMTLSPTKTHTKQPQLPCRTMAITEALTL